MRQTLFLAVLIASGVLVNAQPRFRPAQYLNGALPINGATLVFPNSPGGGQVFVEATITTTGRVGDLKILRTSPTFTEPFVDVIRTWRFRPAEQLTESSSAGQPPQWKPIETKILLASVVAAPALLGPTSGNPPRNVADESDETPFPMTVAPPLFPPLARDGGVVLVQVTVGLDGRVTEATVRASSRGSLDRSALTAAQAWTFRPARRGGFTIATQAYIAFTFRQPVLADD